MTTHPTQWTYRIDLFLGDDWIAEVELQATSIAEADLKILKLGDRFWGFSSWGHPRRVRRPLTA